MSTPARYAIGIRNRRSILLPGRGRTRSACILPQTMRNRTSFRSRREESSRRDHTDGQRWSHRPTTRSKSPSSVWVEHACRLTRSGSFRISRSTSRQPTQEEGVAWCRSAASVPRRESCVRRAARPGRTGGTGWRRSRPAISLGRTRPRRARRDAGTIPGYAVPARRTAVPATA